MRRLTAGLAATLCVLGGVAALPATAAPEPGALAPVVDLVEGRGDGRVEVTRNGRHAVVHQGSSYEPEVLLKVDLTSTPPRVVGQVAVPADADSRLAVAANRFAYTTEGQDLWVTDVRGDQPRVLRKVGFRLKGQRATLFDVVVSPNGRFAYATADDWIHTPGSTLLVLKIRKNGVPKVVRAVRLKATHLAVSRDGKRLAAADGNRLHLLDLRKPGKPRRTGRVKVKGDARAVVFGKKSKDAFVLSTGGPFAVSRVNTKRGKVVRRAVLVRDGGALHGGDVAVSANGRQVVVSSSYSDEENPSVWTLDARLRPRRLAAGACYPASVAASLRGPTKGRLYVADSGICEQARLWQVAP